MYTERVGDYKYKRKYKVHKSGRKTWKVGNKTDETAILHNFIHCRLSWWKYSLGTELKNPSIFAATCYIPFLIVRVKVMKSYSFLAREKETTFMNFLPNLCADIGKKQNKKLCLSILKLQANIPAKDIIIFHRLHAPSPPSVSLPLAKLVSNS